MTTAVVLGIGLGCFIGGLLGLFLPSWFLNVSDLGRVRIAGLISFLLGVAVLAFAVLFA